MSSLTATSTRYARRGLAAAAAAALVAGGFVLLRPDPGGTPVATAGRAGTTATATAQAPATSGMSFARGLAAAGDVPVDSSAGEELVQGFRLTGGRFTPIDRQRGAIDAPNSINDRRQIVGYYVDDELVAHGYLYEGGRFRTIDPPGAGTAKSPFFRYGGSYPGRINDRGEVVGIFIDDEGLVHSYLRDRRGRYTTIDLPGAAQTAVSGFNDDGDITGSYVGSDGVVHGFVRERGRRHRTVDFPGASFSSVVSINDDDQMIGFYIDDQGTGQPFVVDRGRVAELDLSGPAGVPVIEVLPSDIDERGRILGTYAVDGPSGGPGDVRVHGFLLTRNHRRSRLTTIDGPGDRVRTEAVDFNDRGDIVGFTDQGRATLPGGADGTATTTTANPQP